MTTTRCFATECYAPGVCRDVYDANGGLQGTGTSLFVAAAMCESACDSECGGRAMGEPIVATVTVRNRLDEQLVSGAEVCVRDTAECATTGADGTAAVQVPALSPVALTITAADYAPTLFAFTSASAENAPTVQIHPTSRVDEWASDSGIQPDATKGAVLFGMSGPDGATVELVPAAGTIVYHDATGANPALTGAIAGVIPKGVIWNVEPGDYDLVFSHPQTSCTADVVSNWPGTAPESARVTVVAGRVSTGAHRGECAAL